MNYKNGIELDSEFKLYQKKAKLWDKAKCLREEMLKCKTRIREIAQELSLLYEDK